MGIINFNSGTCLIYLEFLKEKETTSYEVTSNQKPIVSFMNLGAFVTILGMLNFGYKLTNDALWLSENPNQVGKHLEKIAQPFEARTFVNSKGDTLRYRLLKPMDYDSTKKYPIVLSLHGSSGCGTDNVKQVAAAVTPKLLSGTINRTKFPAFIYVPQCPRQYNWGGITGQQAIDSLVLEGMIALEKKFSIDINRRYITGISLGGYGTWHLIATRPELFAAAIPICGGGNPASGQNMVGVPIWAFHGAKDKNVPVSGSRNLIQAIKNVGGNPRYTEYPEEAHHIGDKVIATPGLLEWLFAQKRIN